MTWLSITALFLASIAGVARGADGTVAPAAGQSVLFVGNSLSYVNNLPALFAGLANAQDDGTTYAADLVGAPGGTLAERWQDGVAAGEIASGRWHVLVLQERGGQLACLAQPEHRADPDCIASVNAHKHFADLARAHGLQVIVLGTWGPDAIWQSQLSRGLRKVADVSGARAVDAGPLVRAYGKAHDATAMTVDDMGHPSVAASLLVAAQLYRAVHGQAAQPRPFSLTAAVLPTRAAVRPDQRLSLQADLAGDGHVTAFDAAFLQPLFAAAAE